MLLGYRLALISCWFIASCITVFGIGDDLLRSWHQDLVVSDPVQRRDILADFSNNFEFGLATAPAHVEDQLEDSWIEWGREGLIPFWKTVPQPNQRLKFWSNAEVEIDMAAQSSIKIFRMGVDWGRLMPYQPGAQLCNRKGLVIPEDQVIPEKLHPCRNGIQDYDAMQRYVEIMQMVRQKKMIVMLTLFHHSLPKWANAKTVAGWTNPQMVDYFLAFVRDVIPMVAALTDRYVTLNEPAVFANLAYGVCMWPGRLQDTPDLGRAYWNLGKIQGSVIKAFENMSNAHKKAYLLIKQLDTKMAESPQERINDSPAMVGIAHNMAYYQASSFVTKPVAAFLHYIMNLDFLNRVDDHLDYLGINYYGTEFASTTGAALLKSQEYSESGRAISPQGFYEVLSLVHEEYNVKANRNLPIWITENGISDSTDILRPSYMIEHLLVIQKARDEGIPVQSYVFWTISDNWEWADGYCPKFGLISVDRESKSLTRHPRPSFYLFRRIVETKQITQEQRESAWKLVQRNRGKYRPFCRSENGKDTVEELIYRRFVRNDWRLDYKLDHWRRWPLGFRDDSDISYHHHAEKKKPMFISQEDAMDNDHADYVMHQVL